MNSRNARPIVLEALRGKLGREPTLPELYAVQAVARFDGGYGNFKSPPHGPEGPSSNNWGAVQDRKNFSQYVIWTGITSPSRQNPEVAAMLQKAAPASPKPNEFFYASDFLLGKGWFYGPYKVYPNPVDGAAHVVSLLKRMGVLEVANRPGATWNDVARQMHKNKYFVGYSKDPEVNIRQYAKNLEDGGKTFAKLFGETDPLVVAGGVSDSSRYSELEEQLEQLPILQLGSQGNAVALWQRIVAEGGDRPADDGIFGPFTKQATEQWQLAHGLLDDGIVGPLTWAKAP